MPGSLIETIEAKKQEELEIKTKFARYWLENISNPYSAALRLFANPAEAYQRARDWAKDEYVLAELDRLKQTITEEELLPTKAMYLRELLEHARSLRTNDPDNGFKYDNLYASMRGHIEKPASASVTVNNNLTVNRVMVQKDFGNDDEYAVTLEAQQQALMHDNSDAITNASNNG